ncbi:MAG: permease [Gorillibacterium sp.]|nr:permease [Gorillibacterium sp.]
MNMTHYMGLLADNQPWNLILFMAIPVIFAEAITISEFFILFTKNFKGSLRAFNRTCSILAGLYFTGIFLYLFTTAFIPLTVNGEWHTWVDVVAVGFYLSGVLFLLPLALLDLGIIGRKRTEEGKQKLHFILVSGFLVVAHIAMIFGMVNPEIIGGMGNMPGM